MIIIRFIYAGLLLCTFTSVIFSLKARATIQGCGAEFCKITSFSGTVDEQIRSAISAAKYTSHKTVYFPNGTYNITKSIQISDGAVHLKLKGQSEVGTVLNYVPTPAQIGTVSALPPMINIDRKGGFSNLVVEISNLTLDMSALRSHPYYLYPTGLTTSASAHGIRVGNGWDSGRLTLRNIRINNSGGYGIGVGTTGSDKNADNILLQNIHIENAGMDAFDSKSPDSRLNTNLRIFDLYVNGIGQNDSGNSVGIDVRFSDFYIQGYSFYSDANVVNPQSANGATTTGIELRSKSAAGLGGPSSANDGIVRNLDIRGGNTGIFVDRNNSDIVFKIARIYETNGPGIYIRDATDITLKVGCVWSTSGPTIRMTGTNTNVTNLFAHRLIPQCPSSSQVGSNYRKDF